MNTWLTAISVSFLLFTFYCSPYSRSEDSAPIAKERAFDYYLKGLQAYQNGDLYIALGHVEKAIDVNNHFAQFYELQGDILLSLGNDEKALAAFYDALNYRSNYTVVLIKIGEIFFTQGNYSSAIQYFNKALTSDNTRYYLYLDIANSYLRSADYPRALYSLKEYQRFLKQYQDVKDKRYYTIAGETYFYLERFNDSIEELKKAEQSEKVLYLLGRNYYTLKDFDTGLPFFNILMNRDQSEGMWYFYRAIYFYQKADYEDALSQFKQALTLNPGIFDAHYFIGKIHEINKNYRAAWESFRLFRESMTEHDELRYINEKVILPEDDYMID